MRRGGFGKERSDQPGPKDVPVTPVMKVLHPFTKGMIGVTVSGCGIASLFTWDWRYFIASLFATGGALLVGPWVWPHERVRLEEVHHPLDLGDDEVHL